MLVIGELLHKAKGAVILRGSLVPTPSQWEILISQLICPWFCSPNFSSVHIYIFFSPVFHALEGI